MTEHSRLSLEERMKKAGEMAAAYHDEGLNCAECVAKTFFDLHETGLPPETIRLATGFGGGIGRSGNICGAISGAVMSLGTIYGRETPMAGKDYAERRAELPARYAPFRELANEIQETYGTLICRELTAPLAEIAAGAPNKKDCARIIAYCAALTEKYAYEAEQAQADKQE